MNDNILDLQFFVVKGFVKRINITHVVHIFIKTVIPVCFNVCRIFTKTTTIDCFDRFFFFIACRLTLNTI